MILKPITLTLMGVLQEDDKFLPIKRDDRAKLLSILPVGEQMYLTVSDYLYSENILVENQCGEVIIKERGVDSDIHKFPVGSCVRFELTVPVVKWLICNYDCCTGAAGETQPPMVDADRTVIPSGMVNNPYVAHIVFEGTEPMKLTIAGQPEWAAIDLSHRHVFLYGTPVTPHTYNVVVTAVNGQGQNVVTYPFSIVIR